MIKLEISTHSGDVDTVEVEKYDANKVVKEINDESILAVAFGENVYSRIDLKNIKKIAHDKKV